MEVASLCGICFSQGDMIWRQLSWADKHEVIRALLLLNNYPLESGS